MRHDGLMATVFAFFQKKKQHALEMRATILYRTGFNMHQS